jgi:hypothetical protein
MTLYPWCVEERRLIEDPSERARFSSRCVEAVGRRDAIVMGSFSVVNSSS